MTMPTILLIAAGLLAILVLVLGDGDRRRLVKRLGEAEIEAADYRRRYGAAIGYADKFAAEADELGRQARDADDTADWAVDLAGRCTEHVRTVEDQLADAGRRAAVMAKMIDRQRDRADRLFDTCGELRAKIRSAFDCGLNRN